MSEKAQFNTPVGVAVGPDGTVYVADCQNHCIRKIQGNQVSTLAGCGTKGFADGPAAQAQFNYPCGVAVGYDGTVYVADYGNSRIRSIKGGQVTTLAGSGTSAKVRGKVADGPAAEARFHHLLGIAVGPDGAIYASDSGNNRICRIHGGQVSTIAGSGTAGSADGPAAQAQFNFPQGLAVDHNGTIYVADRQNNRIRRINGGQVSTLAGSGRTGHSDGPSAQAQFNNPKGISVGYDGAVYVADHDNNCVRKIQGGHVTTLAGRVASVVVPPQAFASPFVLLDPSRFGSTSPHLRFFPFYLTTEPHLLDAGQRVCFWVWLRSTRASRIWQLCK